jgi:radical SAM/Cys-rich protein
MNRFERLLQSHQVTLSRVETRVLQLNIGKKCNQNCVHCHVNAGPARREVMSLETMEKILSWLAPTNIPCVDITGGAPELNPHFRYLVSAIKQQGRHVMDRCNLTVMFEPEQEDLAEFLAENEVEIVASLPCYGEENVDAQRGDGVFEKSIAALQKLNTLGYGQFENLRLNLVYNPLGAFLPPPQVALESDYKRELLENYGVKFNSLYALTNLPISRFEIQLRREGKSQEYIELLEQNFNPATIGGLMCRDTINVGWQGEVYDCDFNGMLHLEWDEVPHLWDLEVESICGRPIATGNHCLGCTAGAGSSCGGALT